MRDHAVEDIAEKPDEKHSVKSAYRVLYDGQCEICRACVSWLKALDHENKTVCLPINTPEQNIAVQIRGLTADRAEGVAGGERD
jgi:predicted DCC family thiol-disulfide oxidoreductase YuxK